MVLGRDECRFIAGLTVTQVGGETDGVALSPGGNKKQSAQKEDGSEQQPAAI